MYLADWIRSTLAVAGVIIALWLFLLTARYFKDLSYGQRLWATGAIGVLIYVADGLREAAIIHLPFRWRLIPLAFGLIAYFAYLLEPRQRKRKRFGQEPLARRRDGDPL